MSKTIKRECQPCTACCDGWVQMNIKGTDVYPGQPCPHSTGTGCNDYEGRPYDPCVKFQCGWVLDNNPLPEWMKPSNSKVIVIFNKMEWQGSFVDLAVPVGKKIPPRALNWLTEFAEKNMRPLLYTEQILTNGTFSKEQNVIAYGPPEFQQQALEWKESGIQLW